MRSQCYHDISQFQVHNHCHHPAFFCHYCMNSHHYGLQQRFLIPISAVQQKTTILKDQLKRDISISSDRIKQTYDNDDDDDGSLWHWITRAGGPWPHGNLKNWSVSAEPFLRSPQPQVYRPQILKGESSLVWAFCTRRGMGSPLSYDNIIDNIEKQRQSALQGIEREAKQKLLKKYSIQPQLYQKIQKGSYKSLKCIELVSLFGLTNQINSNNYVIKNQRKSQAQAGKPGVWPKAIVPLKEHIIARALEKMIQESQNKANEQIQELKKELLTKESKIVQLIDEKQILLKQSKELQQTLKNIRTALNNYNPKMKTKKIKKTKTHDNSIDQQQEELEYQQSNDSPPNQPNQLKQQNGSSRF